MLAILLTLLLAVPALAQTYPGGFVEDQGVATRSPLTASQIAAFIPSTRSAFTFPAPYNTRGYRLTIPSDCGGQDCVDYVGYSYWLRVNNHVNDSFLYVMLGLQSSRGGSGLTVFRLDKAAGTVTKVGDLFNPGQSQQTDSGEDYYWSFGSPYRMYFTAGTGLWTWDFVAKQFATPVDILNRSYTTTTNQLVSIGCTTASCDRHLYQWHSSADDTIHSGTLRTNAGTKLGCLTYNSITDVFRFYAPVGTYDECHLDRTGRYTISLEQTVPGDLANRIFDNTTGQLVTTKSGPSGTLGHMDFGYGYAIGTDNNGTVPPNPNATVRYDLPAATPTTMIHYNVNLSTNIMQHPSHTNAVPLSTRTLANQYFCGSDTTREIMCARVDGAGTLKQLVVAPVMTDPNATGGFWNNGAYGLQPKGHLDVTGRYFLWTTNLSGNRLDAFLVEVPGHLLVTLGDTVAPLMPTGVSVQ